MSRRRRATGAYGDETAPAAYPDDCFSPSETEQTILPDSFTREEADTPADLAFSFDEYFADAPEKGSRDEIRTTRTAEDSLPPEAPDAHEQSEQVEEPEKTQRRRRAQRNRAVSEAEQEDDGGMPLPPPYPDDVPAEQRGRETPAPAVLDEPNAAPVPPMTRRRETDGFPPYPDSAYGAPESGAPRRGQNMRKPHEETPADEDATDDRRFPRYTERTDKRDENADSRSKWSAFWGFLAALCLGLLIFLGWTVYGWYRDYAPFRQKAAVVAQNTIAKGVLVDGVHVGGMTRSQAVQALIRAEAQMDQQLNITVQVDDQTWIITPQELSFVRNTADVLNTAYAVGRQGTAETIATGVTPFEYRYQHLYHAASAHVSLHTDVTYNPESVRALVEIIRASMEKEAVDAQVQSFDFAARSFTFTEGRAGVSLDEDALYDRIIGALNRHELNAVITVSTQAVTPGVTKAELMNTYTQIASFSTETTADVSRNTNVRLACNAVSGTTVLPGEVFSFNQTVGERTADKGYLPAPAIADGATVDELGGGVCQVSSTLFNAAALANLTILERSPHTWPSNYVDMGRDATVNWPGLDFSFRNDMQAPVFIVAWYRNRTCAVELYGAAGGAGESVELETKTLSVTEPPNEPWYEHNPVLAEGTMREKKKARTGYVVETYRVYLRNGRETRRELLCTSDYPMIQQVMEYN